MVKVYVINRAERGFCFRWHDGQRWREKKSPSSRRSAAEREAVAFADQLDRDAGRAAPMTWPEFCNRYEDEHVSKTSEGNRAKWSVVRRRFQKYLQDRGQSAMPLTNFTPRLVAGFRDRLTRDLPSEASATSYFATFRAGISYASELEICPIIPTIRRRGKSAPSIRGRGVTEAEFGRMLEAVPSVVGRERAAEFEKTLKMLWLGGLRLGEPLDFHTEHAECHRFELDGNEPVAAFRRSQKNRKAQRIYVVPDWARFLRSIDLGSGWICKPVNDQGQRIESGSELGKIIGTIGKAANVIVADETRSSPPRYATAQNLRQGFGLRWATRVMPATLQHLMRHSSITTTMRYYVRVDASVVAKDFAERGIV